MSTARHIKLLTPEEYLELEEKATVKHEYVNGFLYAQAGTSDSHTGIYMSLVRRLYDAAEAKGCRPYGPDMKLRTSETVFYYPDFMVVCEQNEHEYYKKHPCFIVEILSRSTAHIDKRDKLWAYLKIPSLQAYILIDSRKKHVQAYYRQEDGWLEQTWEDEGEVPFPCIDLSLSLKTIYGNLTLKGKG